MLVLAVCFVRPAFLLIDVPGGWARKGEHRINAVIYMAAPELLAAVTVFGGRNGFGVPIGVALWISDAAGLLALGSALHSGVTPAPLMVGYLVTILAGVTIPLCGSLGLGYLNRI